jgi:Undecaprenyl-phosphate glucose phosphotransferase
MSGRAGLEHWTHGADARGAARTTWRGRAFAAETAPLSPLILATGFALLDGTLTAGIPLTAGLAFGEGWPDGAGWRAIMLAVVLMLGFMARARGYARETVASPEAQIRAALAGGFCTMLTLAAIYAASAPDARVPHAWAAAAGVTVPMLAAARALATVAIGRLAPRALAARTVIVGDDPAHVGRVVALLHRGNPRALRLIGFVAPQPAPVNTDAEAPPWLGTIETAQHMIRDGQVDQVIVGIPWSHETEVLAALDALADYPVPVRLAPDLLALRFAGRSSSRLGGLACVHVLDRPISGWASLGKRAEDLVVGTLALVLLAPVLALLACAIKLDSPGPVLFRQRRTGFNDRSFELLKLRTMRDAPPDYHGQQQATRHDARVTRVGAFLRQTSLDELPQLINVLRGEMSLVGPRPHAPGTRAAGRPFEDVVARYAARHRVRPGMTGLAQVRGFRGETATEDRLVDRVESDLEYIERWSLLLDLAIMARTVGTVLMMRNAY